MNELDLTGMLLSEAKEALAHQGIQDYKIVVTAPPRQTDRAVRDDFRVLLVNHEKASIELLVCGKINGDGSSGSL
ncbi:MAG: hypothetical protein KBA53_11100 [Thermoclostridium sp.]|nr:hypothetical protein [Thermoclostridium sp.]